MSRSPPTNIYVISDVNVSAVCLYCQQQVALLCCHQLAASCSVVDRRVTFDLSSISLTPPPPPVSQWWHFVLVDSCCLADVIYQVVSLLKKKTFKKMVLWPSVLVVVLRSTVTVGLLCILSMLCSSQASVWFNVALRVMSALISYLSPLWFPL